MYYEIKQAVFFLITRHTLFKTANFVLSPGVIPITRELRDDENFLLNSRFIPLTVQQVLVILCYIAFCDQLVTIANIKN